MYESFMFEYYTTKPQIMLPRSSLQALNQLVWTKIMFCVLLAVVVQWTVHCCMESAWSDASLNPGLWSSPVSLIPSFHLSTLYCLAKKDKKACLQMSLNSLRAYIWLACEHKNIAASTFASYLLCTGFKARCIVCDFGNVTCCNNTLKDLLSSEG